MMVPNEEARSSGPTPATGGHVEGELPSNGKIAALKKVLEHSGTKEPEQRVLLGLFDRLIAADAPNVKWLFERNLQWLEGNSEKAVTVSFAGLEALSKLLEERRAGRETSRVIMRVLSASCDPEEKKYSESVDSIIKLLAAYRGDFPILGRFLTSMATFNLHLAAERAATAKQKPAQDEAGQKVRAASGQSVRVENLQLLYRKDGARSDGEYYGPDSFLHITELLQFSKSGAAPAAGLRPSKEAATPAGPKLPANVDLPVITLSSILDSESYKPETTGDRVREAAQNLNRVLQEAVKLRDELALLLTLEGRLAAEQRLVDLCRDVSGRGGVLTVAGRLIKNPGAAGEVPEYVREAHEMLSDPVQRSELSPREQIKLQRVVAAFVLAREFLPMSFAVDHLLKGIETWEKLPEGDSQKTKFAALASYAEHLRRRKLSSAKLSVHELVKLLKESPILEFRKEQNLGFYAANKEEIERSIKEFAPVFTDPVTGGIRRDCLSTSGGRLAVPKERLLKETVYLRESQESFFRRGGVQQRILAGHELRSVLETIASWNFLKDGDALFRLLPAADFREQYRNLIGAEVKVRLARNSLNDPEKKLRAVPYSNHEFLLKQEIGQAAGMEFAEFARRLENRSDIVTGIKPEKLSEIRFYMSAGILPEALLPLVKASAEPLGKLSAIDRGSGQRLSDAIKAGWLIPDASLTSVLENASLGLLTRLEISRLERALQDLTGLQLEIAASKFYSEKAPALLGERGSKFIIAGEARGEAPKVLSFTDLLGELRRFESFSAIDPQGFDQRWTRFAEKGFDPLSGGMDRLRRVSRTLWQQAELMQRAGVKVLVSRDLSAPNRTDRGGRGK